MFMKLFICLLSLFFLLTCASLRTSNDEDFKLISYLDIQVDSTGNLPVNPYIIDLENLGKRLVVIGTQHSYDSLNPMYLEMEKVFYSVAPEVIINEGGDLTKTYSSLSEAIAMDSDLGFVKFLADSVGIETVNGDEPERLEFEELADAYSREEAILFYGSERFMFPYLFGEFKGKLPELYESIFIANLMNYHRVKLKPSEQKFTYYQEAYANFFHQNLDWGNFDQLRDSISQLDFIPFQDAHHFNKVARTSKELRDRYLLRTIEEQLERHDIVMVVYGGWHVLAIEPALKQIIQRIGN